MEKVGIESNFEEIQRGTTLFINNHAWEDLVSRLRNQDFFMKWLGLWPIVTKTHAWIDQNWG